MMDIRCSATASFIERRFWFLVTAVALLNLWFFSALDLYMIANAGYDDALFIRLAASIAGGEWLGHFDELTLIKGCFYPIFIALSCFLRLPLLFAEHLLYLASGALLVGILKARYRNGFALLLIFALFAFNPALTNHEALRVFRDTIYVSETVFLFAAVLGLLFSYMERGKVVLWSIVLGVAVTLFWLTREEGIWMLPVLVSVPVSILCHCCIRRRGQKIARLCLILLIPFLILFSGIKLVSAINYSLYGVGITTEFQADYFRSAYGSLTRVKGERWRRYVPVPGEVRQKLYDVSPAFSELRPWLEGDAGEAWIKEGASYIDPCDDFSSHFVWAFRDAVAKAGYYESAPRARGYYVRLAREVNDACERGLLACYGTRKTMAPVFRKEYIAPTLEKLLESFKYVNRFGFSAASRPDNTGTPFMIELFEKLTNHRSQPRDMKVSVSGWVFSPGKEALFGITSGKEGAPFLPMNVLPSPEIHDRFKKLLKGRNIEGAKNCRFDFTAPLENTELVLLTEGKEPYRLDLRDLKGIDAARNNGPLLYHIRVSDPARSVIRFKTEMLKKVGQLYSVVMPKLFAAAVIFLFFGLVLRLRRGENLLLSVFNALLLSAILARHGLLSYIDVTTFGGFNVLYHQPTYALTLLFCGLSLFDLTEALFSRENLACAGHKEMEN